VEKGTWGNCANILADSSLSVGAEHRINRWDTTTHGTTMDANVYGDPATIAVGLCTHLRPRFGSV
jgi:hypothetical protein